MDSLIIFRLSLNITILFSLSQQPNDFLEKFLFHFAGILYHDDECSGGGTRHDFYVKA